MRSSCRESKHRLAERQRGIQSRGFTHLYLHSVCLRRGAGSVAQRMLGYPTESLFFSVFAFRLIIALDGNMLLQVERREKLSALMSSSVFQSFSLFLSSAEIFRSPVYSGPGSLFSSQKRLSRVCVNFIWSWFNFTTLSECVFFPFLTLRLE